MFMTKPSHIVSKSDALPGRDAPLQTAESHLVNGNPLKGPYLRATKHSISAWAVSGAPNACFGSLMVFGSPPLAIKVAIRPTQLTMRPAQATQATPKRC